MSLRDHIAVRSAYTRSINVEKHSSSVESVEGYLPTSRALNTLQRVADTFGEREVPRSWSLVGPYGSGKSAFAVFLSALISDAESKLFGAAYDNLYSITPKLAADYFDEVDGTKGYLKVLISGSAEPLLKRVLSALYKASQDAWEGGRGKRPEIIEKLDKAASEETTSTNDLVDLIVELQSVIAASKVNIKGIILIIDELGKFLEYASRHEESNDLFVLQALAEHAQQPSNIPLMQFVMLHKSFDQYAQGLTEQARNQWAAVQGRFEEIPFIENSEQVLRIVSRAIDQSEYIARSNKISASIRDTVEVLENEGALPNLLTPESAFELFKSCYPLHPCSALLLPYLCQQVAQNERTLFSYLGSTEAFGFQSMLDSLGELGM